jgi:hypothetical protein
MMIVRPYDLWLGVDLSNVAKLWDNRANLLDDIRIEFGTQFQTQVNSFFVQK